MEAPDKIEHNEYKEGKIGKFTELASWAQELGINTFQNQWPQQQSESEKRENGDFLDNIVEEIFSTT